MNALTASTVALGSALLLAACATAPGMSATDMPQGLPEAMKVPAGHQVAMETIGVGEITYECREKTAMAGDFEWVFVGPSAVLNDRMGKAVGRYYGPPATWEAADSSRITGSQVAVAPAGAGNIPLQLVKANPAMGMGAMNGVSYVQRLATRGGVAPSAACTMQAKGSKQAVKYQADYIFWKAA